MPLTDIDFEFQNPFNETIIYTQSENTDSIDRSIQSLLRCYQCFDMQHPGNASIET